MEVSIEIKETVVAPYRDEVQTYQTLFGKTKEQTVRIPQTASHTWDVYLTLLPTEEERATMFKFGIHEMWVEKIGIFSEQEIEQARKDYERWADTPNASAYLEMYQKKLSETRTVPIVEYFNNPYIRKFANIRDAHKYIDQLKEKILPTVKSNIEEYSGRVEKHSFSL